MDSNRFTHWPINYSSNYFEKKKQYFQVKFTGEEYDKSYFPSLS